MYIFFKQFQLFLIIFEYTKFYLYTHYLEKYNKIVRKHNLFSDYENKNFNYKILLWTFFFSFFFWRSSLDLIFSLNVCTRQRKTKKLHNTYNMIIIFIPLKIHAYHFIINYLWYTKQSVNYEQTTIFHSVLQIVRGTKILISCHLRISTKKFVLYYLGN